MNAALSPAFTVHAERKSRAPNLPSPNRRRKAEPTHQHARRAIVVASCRRGTPPPLLWCAGWPGQGTGRLLWCLELRSLRSQLRFDARYHQRHANPAVCRAARTCAQGALVVQWRQPGRAPTRPWLRESVSTGLLAQAAFPRLATTSPVHGPQWLHLWSACSDDSACAWWRNVARREPVQRPRAAATVRCRLRGGVAACAAWRRAQRYVQGAQRAALVLLASLSAGCMHTAPGGQAPCQPAPVGGLGGRYHCTAPALHGKRQAGAAAMP